MNYYPLENTSESQALIASGPLGDSLSFFLK